MTTDDDMREIEAALDSYGEACFLEVGDGTTECIDRTKERRDKLLSLIRSKLPQAAGSQPICRGDFDVDLHNDGRGTVAGLHFTMKWKDNGKVTRFVPEQADAEHEQAVEAWSREMNNANNEGRPSLIDRLRRDALRLMRARPATEVEAERDCLSTQCDYYKADLDAIRAMLPATDGVSTQDLVRDYVKAAGELLRAAKALSLGAVPIEESCFVVGDLDGLRAAIEGAERAGVKP